MELARRLAVWLPALLLFAGGCDRDERGRERPRSGSADSPLPGFVVGQVATRGGPTPSRPIETPEHAEVGGRFRRAVRELPMFSEEPSPGPMIDFELVWSAGQGSAEPPPGRPTEGTNGPLPSLGEDEEGEYVVLYMSATGGAMDDPRYQFEVQGIYRERLVEAEPPGQTVERLIDVAIADLVEGIADEAAPRCATNAGLIALLEEAGADAEGLLPAIREVYRRRLAQAAPALRALLDRPDLDVVLAAATALGRLNDVEAVGRLITLISREHRELTELILPVLGQIDTLEARSYLETVADAHESAYIREVARGVLEQMGPRR